MKNTINDFRILLLASLTLGLAPFFPEPHLLGKLRWVLGGAVGMTAIDWFDLAMHGLPWALLIRLSVLRGVQALQRKAPSAAMPVEKSEYPSPDNSL